ncbi:ArsR family transcriptional regulator [Caldimicrobium thiodismutans]|jgi:two-component system phosphate regulon response regulator PhoB|uniref:ArsR family transcriptional regulator n=1 Tax=Caldimicrobium thiodismutans TaxID=1653476 RepID=A0A0U4W2M2_9BACT|nr:response regulator transcription factor [Caldimicrobium thiodismutans]BAU23322.1 ArsR family transcriptional regulator [Caldimicrobium thiodismutans]
MKAKILIIEDNKEIAKLLGEALEEEGYQIELRENLAKAYASLSTMPSLDLIVLDLILPDGDGLSILKYVRESQKYKNIPVVIISAKGQELDRILGFELGADDYVVKPFSLREVLLRIRRLLKKGKELPSSYISCGPFILDTNKKAIFLEGKLLELTATEYKILSFFIQNPQRVFSREELLELIWANEKEYYSRVLDAYICRIRAKLSEAGKCLQTVRGLGYRFVPDL